MESLSYFEFCVVILSCCLKKKKKNNLLFYNCLRKRLGLHRFDLQNPLKINFSPVFELNKIDNLKTARNGKNKLKLTQE